MVKVSMEVRNGAARFGVAVRAESIQRALNLMENRYPSHVVRVKYTEGFLVEVPAAQTEHKLAA